jgi:uncharacterized protein YjbI with pentapeptide repeats
VDLREITFDYYATFDGADLREANLAGAQFVRANLSTANLGAAYAVRTNFQGANLADADLRGAYLQESDLAFADLTRADLRATDFSNCSMQGVRADGANLRSAVLRAALIELGSFVDAILAGSDLSDASLRDANLSGANLVGANLVATNLVRADLSRSIMRRCRVYGASVWNTTLDDAEQTDLLITADGEPDITVDNLEIAQFLYLLLKNAGVRDIIDAITARVVVILGRFTTERKPVLDAVRAAVRSRNYTPLMFDFARPVSRNLIETVATLVGMCKFVIADVTDAKVVLQELHTIVTGHPSVPVQPIILAGAVPTETLVDFMDYPNFLPIYAYRDEADLVQAIHDRALTPAEAMVTEIADRRKRAEDAIARLRSES